MGGSSTVTIHKRSQCLHPSRFLEFERSTGPLGMLINDRRSWRAHGDRGCPASSFRRGLTWPVNSRNPTGVHRCPSSLSPSAPSAASSSKNRGCSVASFNQRRLISIWAHLPLLPSFFLRLPVVFFFSLRRACTAASFLGYKGRRERIIIHQSPCLIPAR